MLDEDARELKKNLLEFTAAIEQHKLVFSQSDVCAELIHRICKDHDEQAQRIRQLTNQLTQYSRTMLEAAIIMRGMLPAETQVSEAVRRIDRIIEAVDPSRALLNRQENEDDE